MAYCRNDFARFIEILQELLKLGAGRQIIHRTMTAWQEDGVEFLMGDFIQLQRLLQIFLGV
ncbi:hypothetical protein D3C76_1606420 [compost metagenome]